MEDPPSQTELLILTTTFPFGSGEPFLSYELETLAKNFGKVYILPTKINRKIEKSEWNGPGKIVNVPPGTFSYTKLSFLGRFFSLFSKGFFNELKEHFLALYKSPRNVYRLTTQLLLQRQLLNFLEDEFLPEHPNVKVLYSYWLTGGASAIALLDSKWLKLTRVHGGDLYQFRYEYSYIPMQKFALERMDMVAAISEHGHRYLNQITPEPFSGLFRLGVKKHAHLSSSSYGEKLSIVSCSSVIPLKQVDKILELFLEVAGVRASGSVRWIHFGSGPLMNDLKELVYQSSLAPCVELRGHVHNSDIHSFYVNSPVDVFVNFSTTEGAPISIMEALSYGVPFVAPNVGGVPELFSEGNGVLFEHGTSMKVLSEKLIKLALESKSQSIRRQIKSGLYRDFDIERNTAALCEEIKSRLNSKREIGPGMAEDV